MQKIIAACSHFDQMVHTQLGKHPRNIGRFYAFLGTLFFFMFEFFAKLTQLNIVNILFVRGFSDTFICLFICNFFIYS